MNYNFYVKSAAEVDISRVLAEAPPNVNAILIVAENAMLLLKTTFLETFRRHSLIVVASEPLCERWGYPMCVIDDGKDTVSFQSSNAPEDLDLVSLGWSCRSFDKSLIEKTLQKLQSARSYVPKCEVRVSYV